MTTIKSIASRRIFLPRDTNQNGDIFGGVILAELDLAGAAEAQKYTNHIIVTKVMNGIEFKSPVHVGDVVTFYARLIKLGNTSITIGVDVESSHGNNVTPIVVTAAEIVYTAVVKNDDGTWSKTSLNS